MKICFITYTVFNLGGIQRVLSRIASEFSKEHEVTILCASNLFKENRDTYNLDEKVRVEFGNDIFSLNFYENIRKNIAKKAVLNIKGLNNIKYAKKICNIYYPKNILNKLTEYINRNNYDVVIAIDGIYGIPLSAIANRIKSKTVIWQHNSYDAYFNNKDRYYWNQDFLFKEYVPKVNKYVVLNDYDKRKYMEEKQLETLVIHNPRSFESIQKSDMKCKKFIAAGRFTYQKGFDLLIESFNKFCSLDQEWKLMIIGEGEEKKNIESLISKYGIEDRVEIHGFTDDIKSYFLQASILLLPSRWEGMPMIVLESLEMGTPIISYDITAINGLISNNVEGIVVNKFNTDEFSDAMFELANSIDKRIDMSNSAIKKSNEFSIDNINQKWKKMINDLF